MPFLKNTWYVAANSAELSEGVLGRTICNQPIAMFRTESGSVAALQDRCPHRFVPLSMGKRVGDSLECGYHGLRFGSSGACVEMPNDDRAVSPPCVKSYPTVERYGVVWLWMGDAHLADPATIPDFSFITDKTFTAGQGYSYIKANYQLIVDNLLDLSHVHYLHPQLHAGSHFADFVNEVKRDGETVWSMLWRPHYHMDDARRAANGFESNDVEGQGHSRWNAPSLILVDTAFWDHGKTMAEGIRTPSAHLITPETEHTSHYFWAGGRNYAIDDHEATAQTAKMMKNVFETQDGPMIEAQQRAMGEVTDFLELRPVILKADAAGVMVRRLLKRLIAQEANVDDGHLTAAE